MVFYKCNTCGNVIAHLNDSGVRCVCCGEEMSPITPNTSDGAGEKHVPIIADVKVNSHEVTVTVSNIEHPMSEEHYIQWVVLETKEGRQRKTFKPGDKPVATFMLTESDSAVAAYAYCNLHGLWESQNSIF